MIPPPVDTLGASPTAMDCNFSNPTDYAQLAEWPDWTAVAHYFPPSIFGKCGRLLTTLQLIGNDPFH